MTVFLIATLERFWGPTLLWSLAFSIAAVLFFSHTTHAQTAQLDRKDDLAADVEDARVVYEPPAETVDDEIVDAVAERWRVPFYRFETARELPPAKHIEADVVLASTFEFDLDVDAFSDKPDDPYVLPPDDRGERFRWGPAMAQSMLLLGIQHGYALGFQEKTRQALRDGNFFGDYWRSLKGLRGWDDGNRFFTNYIAHPMQGGLTGFIYIQNHPRTRTQLFENTNEYWKYRFYAFIWSTAWSTQFELGPISQSTIGNVGMYGGMGMVDLVITPTVGTAWLVGEEMIDRYWIRSLEQNGFFARVSSRMFLNPMRTIANLLRFREPWYRDRPYGRP